MILELCKNLTKGKTKLHHPIVRVHSPETNGSLLYRAFLVLDLFKSIIRPLNRMLVPYNNSMALRTSDLNELTRRSLDLATKYAKGRLRDDGHWCGELKANATITAEYVFLYQALGLDLSADKEAICCWLLSEQQFDGSWTIAPAHPGDVSTTVEAYLALKILGTPVDHPAMVKGRDFVLSFGGVERVRIFTRFYLAAFGLFPWESLPELPAELILVGPKSFE